MAELVKLRVEEGNARKRAELEARKAARAAESEAELKVRSPSAQHSFPSNFPRGREREGPSAWFPRTFPCFFSLG